MKLAYFTPLPPSKSGIADYNSELLPYLANGADITVFIGQPEGSDESKCNLGGGIKILPADRFEQINNDSPFDLNIYHQGNNPYHEYIYERAVRTPGLTVMHEACLHHLIAGKTLGRNDQDGYWNEMFYAYGMRGARAAEIRFGGVGGDYQQFLLPLNRRIVSNSLGVIVHNNYAASKLELSSNNIPVKLITHHLSPSAFELDNLSQSECRKILDIPEDTFVIASFGFVTDVKRLPIALEAFKRLLAVRPNARYYIVGEDHWNNSIATRIAEMGLSDYVKVTGYTTEEDFFKYLKAIDLLVNLRYPTAGETSGTLIRALGSGKPVIVTNFGQFADFPDEVCLKVPLGDDEIDVLYSHMRNCAFHPILRHRIGNEAASWVRRECNIKSSAEKYLQFAEQLIKQKQQAVRAFGNVTNGSQATENASYLHPPPFDFSFQSRPKVEANSNEAIHYLRGFFVDDPPASDFIEAHSKRLLETLKLIPQGDKDRRVLELSSYLQMPPLIKKYGNYGNTEVTEWWSHFHKTSAEVKSIENIEAGEKFSFQMHNVNVERDRFPFENESFDVVLCCELIEHLTTDPMHMMLEINRVLKFGGIVILTTPNIISAFSMEKALKGDSPYIFGEYVPRNPGNRHSREYTPSEIRNALNSSGFKVTELYTKDLLNRTDEAFLASLDYTGAPRILRGDNIFAVGCKLSTIFDRYPNGLYD